MKNFPAKENILHGHTSEETAYLIKDYPYGFRLRCQMKVWIETDKKKGDRYCTMTSNPKKPGTWNKPKKSTYVFGVIFLVKDEKEHVKGFHLSPYRMEDFPDQMKFLTREDIYQNLLSDQAENIRAWYYLNTKINYTYHVVKYSDETKPEFTEYTKAKLKHILKCEFTELLRFGDAPAQDNPEGEVKMIAREYSYE